MIVASGIDVVEIARIEGVLARRGERFTRRICTERELAVCREHGRRPGRLARQLALRFAAKEAGMKAVGTGWARGVRWRDFEALPTSEDGPSDVLSLSLSGRAGEIARQRGAERWHLAVSHDRTHALALVVLEGQGG